MKKEKLINEALDRLASMEIEFEKVRTELTRLEKAFGPLYDAMEAARRATMDVEELESVLEDELESIRYKREVGR